MPARPNKVGGNGNNRGRGRGGGRSRFVSFNHRVNSGRIHRPIGQQGPGSFNRGHPDNVFQRLNRNPEDRSTVNFSASVDENQASSRRNNAPLFGFRRNNVNNRGGSSGSNSSIVINHTDGSTGFSDLDGEQPQGRGRRGLLNLPLLSTPGGSFSNSGSGTGPLNDGGVFGRMEADGSFTPINPHHLLGQLIRPSHRGSDRGHGHGPNRGRFGSGLFGVRPSFPSHTISVVPVTSQNHSARFVSTSLPKNQVCKFHADSVGGCANRLRCLYMHEDFPCKFYHVQGECGEGNKCKFSHDSLNPLKKKALLMHLEKAENAPDGFPKNRADIVAAIERVALGRSLVRGTVDPSNKDNNAVDRESYTVDKKDSQDVQDHRAIPKNQTSQSTSDASTLEFRILSESTKTIPTVSTSMNQYHSDRKSSSSPRRESSVPIEPTIHQIIQAMRRTLQQNEDNKKIIREKAEKENQMRAKLVSNSASTGANSKNSSPITSNPNVQRISRTRPSVESNVNNVVKIPRCRNLQQNLQGRISVQIINNLQVSHNDCDSYLTPADQDERFQLPSVSISNSTANSPSQGSGQLLPFAQTHLDAPLLSSAKDNGIGLGYIKRQQQQRILPTIDDIVSSCVGHGPPFTIWQTCQIYNTCAHHGLQVSIHDFPDFQFQYDRRRDGFEIGMENY